MNMEFTECSRCGLPIKYGAPFVSIARSIEKADYELASDDVTISVIDSVSVATLCVDCGNKFNADNIEKIVKAIPVEKSNN